MPTLRDAVTTGNTAARPATPSDGHIHFNTETADAEMWNTVSWVVLFDWTPYLLAAVAATTYAAIAHAAAHATAGADPITPASIDAATDTHVHTGVYEPVLGNPASAGLVLTSTVGGVRSWAEVPVRDVMAVFTVPGVLSVGSNPLRIYNRSGEDLTISEVFLSVSTAPVGAAAKVDVNQNGVSIFAGGTEPTIAAGANTGVTTTFATSVWTNGSYLTIDVDQIGSTTPGSDLTVHVTYSK